LNIENRKSEVCVVRHENILAQAFFVVKNVTGSAKQKKCTQIWVQISKKIHKEGKECQERKATSNIAILFFVPISTIQPDYCHYAMQFWEQNTLTKRN
jgi:hypothetical protein